MDALVLIVDDHADTREAYEAYLRFVGARVTTAGSGDEAVRLARETLPDVIVMDMRLPGMSGMEAVVALKADKATSAIPVVGLSGRQHSESPCDVFLLKPCTPDQLAAAIRELLLHRKPRTRERTRG